MRPIDADELKEEISSLEMEITGLRAGKGVLVEFMKGYCISILRIVDDAPTIDAVEVVRCKDCKHGVLVEDYYLKNDPPYKYFGRECIVCCHEEMGGDYPPIMANIHFCSYGERKE